MGLKWAKRTAVRLWFKTPSAAFNEIRELDRDGPCRCVLPVRNTGLILESRQTSALPETAHFALGPRDGQHGRPIREISTIMRIRPGGFSTYKRATVLRRIQRRISVRSLPDLSSYSAFLSEHPERGRRTEGWRYQ